MDALIIDLSEILSVKEFHSLFKEQLNFPEFYGMNWNAFWDSITGLVEMPEDLRLKGFDKFAKRFPKDAQILKDIINQYNHETIYKIQVL